MLNRIFLIGVFISLSCSIAFAGEDARIYGEARKMARAGQTDFAFMQYEEILRDYPNSRFAEQALFAQGEYYFMMVNYPYAQKAFQSFLAKYPNSNGKLFALAHLLRMAKSQNDEVSVKNFEKEMIVQKQVSLVFRDRKEYHYKSPLNQPFTAEIGIDKIEIYVGGDLFVAISY